MLEIFLWEQVGRNILSKGQLSHKLPSISEDVFYKRWQTVMDSLPVLPVCVCVRACMSACVRSFHSAVILNQKNHTPAFWMTGAAELPSWSNKWRILMETAAASGATERTTFCSPSKLQRHLPCCRDGRYKGFPNWKKGTTCDFGLHFVSCDNTSIMN